VYEQGVYVGDTSLTQMSAGFQAGGQAYSQIVFFQDARALSEFTSGSFELGADVGDASTAATYHKGLAAFAIAKGGTMYEASVAGQKFSYQPPSAE
jgi:lipid-binding SYLF domain-containing protein